MTDINTAALRAIEEDSNCPYCGALPCDWNDNPHKKEYTLLMVIADIRAAMGVGEKPMLTELAAEITAIRERVEMLEAALNKPLSQSEIIEVGKAIFPYIGAEQTKEVGFIAWSASIAIRNIVLSRAALEGK